MFLNDQPICSSSQDIFGRSFFASSLAESILSHKLNSELVLGLYGEWGSGKTSLLNLTIEKIEELGKDKVNISEKSVNSEVTDSSEKDSEPKINKPIVIKFNPWNFSEQNQLVSQYFSMLSGVLLRKDNSDNLIQIGEKLQEYSDIFEPLSVIPLASPFTSLMKHVMRLFGDALKLKGNRDKKNLEDIRKELTGLLRNSNTKILVIIDDIDRLTPNEIRQIFQLVKKIADFPNIIYLLAFDKRIVLNALKEVHKGFENEYLEKIIQVPFEIPPLSREELFNYLFQQIDHVLDGLPEGEFDQIYWGNIFYGGLNYFFNSLRDVSRFINSLSFNYNLVRDKVNPVDFIAITAIQVFHSELFHSIRSNKDFFAGDKSSSKSDLFDTNNKEKEYYSTIIPEHKNLKKEKLEELLTRLFPKLGSVFSNVYFNTDWSGEWRKKSRICSTECFDYYFNLVLANNDLTPKEMQSILSTANNSDTFRSMLIELNKDNKIKRFLELMEDYTSDDNIIPKSNIQNIVSAIMDLGDSFPEEENKSMYEIDTPMKVLRIFYQLSRRFPDEDSRFNLFKCAIEEASDSIYTIIYEIGVQDEQHGRHSDEKALPDDQTTVSLEHLPVLEQLAVKKIREWKSKPGFITHVHLGSILFFWEKWAGVEEVKEFVAEVIATDHGLVNFVRAFLGRTVSYGASDYSGKVNWSINLKNIEKFITLQNLEPRLRELSRTEQTTISEKENIAINTFLDFFDGKRKLSF